MSARNSSKHGNEEHTVRRIELPSGRSIEVVRFEPAKIRQLHVCPQCNCDLVQPIAWCEDAESRWQLTLECPNCSWLESGLYDRADVERLEDTLDEGLCTMISDLHRLTQANMADDIERFITAVHADQVLPEDF
jgi:hypothetical protein